jgi:predicted TIM-barrel fold metal-dependent hydrolase
MRGRWIIDEPAAAAARIRDLAERFGVDEVMISPAASASAADDPASAPGRLKTLELLAAALRS